jgi:hypothetical protein
MDDDQSQISDVPNLTEAAVQEVHEQFRRAEAVRMAGAPASQGAGATGGAGGSITENPHGDPDRRLAAQIDALMAAVTALTAAQGAAVTAQAPPEAPAALGGPVGTKHQGVIP